MTDVDRSLRAMRRVAIQHERQAQRAILAAWRSTWGSIATLLDGLVSVATQARRQGVRLTARWFTAQPTYRALLNGLQARVGQFVVMVGHATSFARRAIASAIAPLATEVVRAALGIATMGAQMAPFLPIASPLGLVAGLLQALPSIVVDIARTVRAGLVRNLPSRQIATLARQAANAAPVRALATSRTNVHEAAREAALATYRQHPDAIGKWRWVASLGPRCCALCFARHGSLYPLTRSMDTHVGCFTAGHMVSGPRVVGSTIRWYEGDVIEIVTVAGNLLTVTPNHPILTPQGWIAAGLLDEGSEVVSTGGGESPLATVNPNEHQHPALIEDVARTLGGTEGVMPTTVPTTALDFHGDGAGSDVCVVRADGLLRDTFNPTLTQPQPQQFLSGGDMHPMFLSGQRHLAAFLDGVATTLRGTMGSFGVAPMFLGGAVSCQQAVSGGVIAGRNPRFQQAIPDRGTNYVKCLCQSVLGFASKITGDDFLRRQLRALRLARLGTTQSRPLGFVAHQPTLLERVRESLGIDVDATGDGIARLARNVCLDRILKVSRRHFAGHVYNLQTTEGWYSSNNIITHNCRCLCAPEPRESTVQAESGEEVFRRLPRDVQRQVLGPGKLALWESGELASLADLIQQTQSARYGSGMRERSLRELQAR